MRRERWIHHGVIMGIMATGCMGPPVFILHMVVMQYSMSPMQAEQLKRYIDIHYTCV